MSSRTFEYYFDDEEIMKNSFVIETSFYPDYSDITKPRVSMETERYYSKYVDNNYGYSEFKLYRKNGSNRVFLTKYKITDYTIITPEIIDQIGDFVYKSQQELDPDCISSLPVIEPGAAVMWSGMKKRVVGKK